MHLGAVRDQIENHPFCLRGVCGPEHVDPIRFERGSGPLHAGVLRQSRESGADRPIEVLESHRLSLLEPGSLLTCECKQIPAAFLLHMQIDIGPEPEVAWATPSRVPLMPRTARWRR